MNGFWDLLLRQHIHWLTSNIFYVQKSWFPVFQHAFIHLFLFKIQYDLHFGLSYQFWCHFNIKGISRGEIFRNFHFPVEIRLLLPPQRDSVHYALNVRQVLQSKLSLWFMVYGQITKHNLNLIKCLIHSDFGHFWALSATLVNKWLKAGWKRSTFNKIH